MRSSVLSSAKALDVKKAERPAMRISVLRRLLTGLRISDIVKRKRIRSKAGWGEA
jgi:hypothetical protein